MANLFYKLGKKYGSSLIKGKWYYKSLFGSEEEAIEAETWVGRQLAIKITQEMKIDVDPSHQQIANEIGEKLCKRVTDKNRKFRFYVLFASDVNAFALPGGYIFLTDALLKLVDKNRDEIAFVLAHEILHVMLKHPFNRIIADHSFRAVSNIVTKSGVLGTFAKQAIGDLLKKSYSREKELEADKYAVRLMYSAGFDPHSAKTLLRKLEPGSPADLPVYNYFLTHPSIEERIEKIDKLIDEYQMKFARRQV